MKHPNETESRRRARALIEILKACRERMTKEELEAFCRSAPPPPPPRRNPSWENIRRFNAGRSSQSSKLNSER